MKTTLLSLNGNKTQHNKTLIFIHGFLCTSTIWDKIITNFKDTYNIFTVQLPGHNGGNEEIKSLEKLANSIIKEIVINDIVEPHIIGHSLGGYLAGEIAKKGLVKLDSITLINSSLLADNDAKKRDRELAIRATKISPDIFSKNVIQKLFLAQNRGKLTHEIDKIQQQVAFINSTTIISYLYAMKNRETSLHSINKTPIHFIASKNDSSIPFEIIPQQTKKKNTYLTKLHNSGHMSILEESEFVSKSIHSFFVSLKM